MVGVVRGVIQPILEIDDNEDRSMGCHNTLFPSTPDRVLLESLNMWQSSSQPIGWLEWELYGLVLLQFEWVICHKFYFCTSGSHLATVAGQVTSCPRVCCRFGERVICAAACRMARRPGILHFSSPPHRLCSVFSAADCPTNRLRKDLNGGVLQWGYA